MKYTQINFTWNISIRKCIKVLISYTDKFHMEYLYISICKCMKVLISFDSW